jgi:hypothetical protein
MSLKKENLWYHYPGQGRRASRQTNPIKRREGIEMVPEMMKAVLKREFIKGKPGRRQGTRRPATVMTLGLILIIIVAGLLACSSGTGSNTSAGATGTGGSGVGWTVNVKIFSSTISLGKSETTSVVITVRDAAGGAAPKGTRICLSTTHGLIFVDELGKDTAVVTGCVSTSNEIGQLLGTYVPQQTGTDQVQASSMGGFGSATVQITS